MSKKYDYNLQEIKETTTFATNTRANQTATVYNEYILKNNYVWNNNIPSDIYMTLEIIA